MSNEVDNGLGIKPSIKPSGSEEAAAVPPSTPLMTRYADAYRFAQIHVRIGNFLTVFRKQVFRKETAKVSGVLFAIIGMMKGVRDLELSSFLAVMVLGAFFWLLSWLLIWWLGVVFKIFGQMMMSQLDVAVNTSPLLSNEQKAQVMSLQ